MGEDTGVRLRCPRNGTVHRRRPPGASPGAGSYMSSSSRWSRLLSDHGDRAARSSKSLADSIASAGPRIPRSLRPRPSRSAAPLAHRTTYGDPRPGNDSEALGNDRGERHSTTGQAHRRGARRLDGYRSPVLRTHVDRASSRKLSPRGRGFHRPLPASSEKSDAISSSKSGHDPGATRAPGSSVERVR